ncbi:Carbamoyl-phosphate synthase L chain, ATP-binding protein, partial [Acidiphilium sp. PM]
AHRWLATLPQSGDPSDPWSPWATRAAWRLNGERFRMS